MTVAWGVEVGVGNEWGVGSSDIKGRGTDFRGLDGLDADFWD